MAREAWRGQARIQAEGPQAREVDLASIEIAPEVGDDLDRIVDHLVVHGVAETSARIAEIIDAIDVLRTNPRIGRPATGGLRELIIGRGARGYVALYRHVPELDVVFVLAIRSQREAGYTRE